MAEVIIRKLDHTGREVISYPGTVLERCDGIIVLSTAWDGDALDLEFVVLQPGDRWTEYFYSDRWYNVFRIGDREGRLKGWYCNVTRPAKITEREVAAEDLALDLWVAPNGEMTVLDEEEFDHLPLSCLERRKAREALQELKDRAAEGRDPFDTGDSLYARQLPRNGPVDLAGCSQ